MKCIDSIEGTVKCILNRMHTMCIENQLDDSEYIRNAKTIIDAAGQYVNTNPEVSQDPQLLKKVLYIHSRNLWLMDQGTESQSSSVKALDQDAQEYQTYYFDYVYDRGVYPR